MNQYGILFYTEELSSPFDEGIKRVALTIAEALPRYTKATIVCSTGSKEEGIEKLHIVGSKKPFYKLYFNKKLGGLIKNSQAEIVLYLPSGPLHFGSFMRARILSHRAGAAKTVMYLLQMPALSGIMTNLIIRFFHPDTIFVPSREMAEKLDSIGCNAKFIPLGVDLQRFRPASSEHKSDLRRKYDIEPEAFVVLHVGHFTENRNLRSLIDVQKAGIAEVIVVGSTSTPHDSKLIVQLRDAGILCFDQFIPDIWELYQLSDLYVFPTLPGTSGCIEMPLSVLEAMACNVRVASTRYGGLPDVFEEKNGFWFIDSNEGLIEIVEESTKTDQVKTREMVEPYGWEKLIKRLITELLAETDGF